MLKTTKVILWFLIVGLLFRLGAVFFFFADYPEYESGFNDPTERERIPFVRAAFGTALSEENSRLLGVVMMGTGLAIVIFTIYAIGFIEQRKEQRRKERLFEYTSLSSTLKRKREREAKLKSSQKNEKAEPVEIANT